MNPVISFNWLHFQSSMLRNLSRERSGERPQIWPGSRRWVWWFQRGRHEDEEEAELATGQGRKGNMHPRGRTREEAWGQKRKIHRQVKDSKPQKGSHLSILTFQWLWMSTCKWTHKSLGVCIRPLVPSGYPQTARKTAKTLLKYKIE